ncbi:hypothetical protein GCM10008107_07980 [Psychrosphaera saromensis]|uniref:SseB protein N-terminal domain-containing protein n=1 Tax=Psychrosphaera saromensis TaxID=716813 RepID=A0A2S7UVV6_9GAMM|nr:SseB family protein [Psychrosphaera saromensis]PQJ53899.1 hypothetical protein BTO11_09635 [Psychrosphaera saromensis]GHB61526.1 hypothetical protein GCM10008107_07980 [Psychrosphaera saromensis]GLQ15301.1 hypothetical protein GCM10007917_27560 [Psychrosphaera saromensis]
MLKKLKSLLFGKDATPSQPIAEGAPPIDVKVAVTNPSLVDAMNRLNTDQSSAAKTDLLLELNKSNYLAAIFSDEMNMSEPDENGNKEIEKGSLIKVLNTSDSEGNIYLPLFTDWCAIKNYINKPVDTLVFSPQKAWSWALSDYHGVVIYSEENSLPLNKSQIQYLASKVNKPT